MPLTTKIRVGFNARYLRDYNLRGFNRYTVSLLTELQKRSDVEPILFTDQHSPIHPRFREVIQVETIAVRSWKVLLWEHMMVPRSLRSHRIDLFHAPGDGGLPAWKACPYVLTYHHAVDKMFQYWVSTGDLPGRVADYAPEPGGWRGRYLHYRHALLRAVYLRAADKILAVSDYGKWELTELLGVAEERIEVVYEAADERFSPDISADSVGECRARLGLPDRYLLFVGGFDLRKNVHGLLRAYAEARKAGVQDGLVLVGTGGDLDVAKALARSLNLAEGREVVFLQRIHEDLPSVYRGATAFVTLSWGESFCLPVVEAMSCGTPVVVSNRAATPEVVADAGLLVDPRNLDEVVQALKAVTGQPHLQQQLKAKGLRRARKFSWKKAADETVAVYEQVLSQATRIRGRLR